MVLPRRHHGRPRRRHGCIVGAAAVCVLLYFFYLRRPLDASSHLYPKDGSPEIVFPEVNLYSGNPPLWRDPQRDFDAEYQEVLRAVPALKATRPARIAFLVMAHGSTDVKMLQRSLPWLYSPNCHILVSSRMTEAPDLSCISWR